MFPTIFVSHGSPGLAIEASPTRDFLERLGGELGAARAVICVSAHWGTARPALTGAAFPETIHDFFGFPPRLYQLRYPAPGAPELAAEAAELLRAAGITADIDAERGLDHGAWAPLSLMYPDADVPVIQLSVQSALGSRHHYAVGRALMPLRKRSVLIMGSGGATHNLREALRHGSDPEPVDYAKAFDDWLEKAIVSGEVDALLDYERVAPSAKRAHPTPEHLLPLFVPLGAAGGATACTPLHRAFELGVLSMSAYRWD